MFDSSYEFYSEIREMVLQENVIRGDIGYHEIESLRVNSLLQNSEQY